MITCTHRNKDIYKSSSPTTFALIRLIFFCVITSYLWLSWRKLWCHQDLSTLKWNGMSFYSVYFVTVPAYNLDEMRIGVECLYSNELREYHTTVHYILCGRVNMKANLLKCKRTRILPATWRSFTSQSQLTYPCQLFTFLSFSHFYYYLNYNLGE